LINKVNLNSINPNRLVLFKRNLSKTSPNCDEFVSSKKVQHNPTKRETLLKRLPNKLSLKTINKKVNEILLTALFDDAKSIYTFHGIKTEEVRDFIKELSALDYDNIDKKYTFLTETVNPHRRIVPTFIRNILSCENITKETLESLYKLLNSKNSVFSGGGQIYRLEMMVYYLNHYDEFDTMSTKNQYDFIDKIEYYFDAESIGTLDEDDDLMRFNLIKDIKKLASVELMKQELTERAKNTPVASIKVEESIINDFINGDVFSFENLKDSIGKTNLREYKKGLPLKYSRTDFIADFKRKISTLSEEEKKEVYKHYQFNIDSEDDIIKFPSPNNSSPSNASSRVQKAISETEKLVENFVLNNEIRLNKEDKKAQDVLNQFIKVFPEFVSVIGKIQHRGDSIDFHTLDDLKRCLLDPRTKTLSPKEQRILFLSVMFHDIAKKQGVVDKGHQKPSAYYAKEILKKLPITYDEKERIYNLIYNSHWTTDGSTIQDIALNFRYNNDFKMAQILAKADGASAGFDFPVTSRQLEDIQKCIDKINSTGIPLFADNLPDDKTKFPINKEGIRYLDFTDENKDLSEYGFKKGTTVKDLNFLCHNTTNSIEEFIGICDDSKEICLSAELKNGSNRGIITNYNSGYNGNSHVILHCSNENIGAGGIDVSCTGGKKGRREFKNYVFTSYFQEPENNFQRKLTEKYRTEISNGLKEKLNLDDMEYAEFFSKINDFKTKEDIQDIELSTGKTLRAKQIIEALSDLQKQLTKNTKNESYINEIIIFRPKVEAIIMGKYGFFHKPIEKSDIKKVAKENNIPVILV